MYTDVGIEASAYADSAETILIYHFPSCPWAWFKWAWLCLLVSVSGSYRKVNTFLVLYTRQRIDHMVVLFSYIDKFAIFTVKFGFVLVMLLSSDCDTSVYDVQL